MYNHPAILGHGQAVPSPAFTSLLRSQCLEIPEWIINPIYASEIDLAVPLLQQPIVEGLKRTSKIKETLN